MAAFLDNCRFTPTLGGTTDWAFSVAVAGCMSPSAACAVNGMVYKYIAISNDLTQMEMGEGAYNSSTNTFARTTVLYNSSGTGTKTPGQSGAGTKINFSTVPQVAIIGIKEDLISVEEANSFTATQQAQAANNILAITGAASQSLTASEKAQALSNLKLSAITTTELSTAGSGTYTTPANVRWLEVYIVGAGGGGGGANTTTTVAGSAGTASTFDGVSANPGSGAVAPATTIGALGGNGGKSGTGTATRRVSGQAGGAVQAFSSTQPGHSGFGGASGLGGGGGSPSALTSSSGLQASPGTVGGGGGGAWFNSTDYVHAPGGGGGELAYLIIDNPAASYSYTVGAPGAGGSASQSGAAGSPGYIFIVEHYGLP